MSVIKSFGWAFAIGAAYVIGFNAGEAVWEAGLDEVVEKKARKLFSKVKKES